MSDLKPTDEQRAVIEYEEPRFVVAAAAGSGKTWVLVQRYLRYVLREGLDPREVLAITFTDKAASEMRRRIVHALNQAGRRDAAQAAEAGPISTIHSFCHRLLQEHAIEACIDPEFDLVANADRARRVAEAVREVLASPPNAMVSAAERIITRLIASGGPRDQSVYFALESAVASTLNVLRGKGIDRKEILRRHADEVAVRTFWRDLLLSDLSQVDPLASEALRPLVEDEEGFVAELRKLTQSRKLKKSWPVVKGLDPESETYALLDAVALVRLAVLAWDVLERQMDRDRILDYDALESRAVRLVESSLEARRKLAERFKAIMVDESQDLNPLQHRLLDALPASRLMYVGDVQQSIYGFRQADVELFAAKSRELPTLTLARNHRSIDGILRFVDDVSARVWGESYQRMAPVAPLSLDAPPADLSRYEGVEIWPISQANTFAGEVAAGVEQLIQEGESPGKIAVLVRSWRSAEAIHKELSRRKIDAVMAGGESTFYTRLEVRDLANALRAVTDPRDDFSLLATLRSPMAGLSLDAVALLAQQAPVHSALAGFESPVAEDRDKLERFLGWFRPLSTYADRLSAWEVLGEVEAKSGYIEALALREDGLAAIANARKLLLVAAQHPQMSPRDFAEWIRQIESLKHQEGDAIADETSDAVTLITVHKAKGLQYPVVIYADTLKGTNNNANLVEADARLATVSTKVARRDHMFHAFLAKRRLDFDRQEMHRLMYVALTRAERRLCVAIGEAAEVGSVSRTIAEAVGLKRGAHPELSIRRLDRPKQEQEPGDAVT